MVSIGDRLAGSPDGWRGEEGKGATVATVRLRLAIVRSTFARVNRYKHEAYRCGLPATEMI